ncbi:EGF region [Echinococcus multilocularis]|uniref:EGF region n=1 Tax=Echinococcus multilocularis TaxID=6211 RepID=A0A068XUT7_ECHMU|nr:EGF region [Echinococcus multilocularis]
MIVQSSNCPVRGCGLLETYKAGEFSHCLCSLIVMGTISSWWRAINVFTVFLLLTDSHVLVTECPSGTPTCSHGRCIRRTGWDEQGKAMDEEQCICKPNYYGKACTLLLVAEFSDPQIVSPGDVTLFSLDEPDDYEGGEPHEQYLPHRRAR